MGLGSDLMNLIINFQIYISFPFPYVEIYYFGYWLFGTKHETDHFEFVLTP